MACFGESLGNPRNGLREKQRLLLQLLLRAHFSFSKVTKFRKGVWPRHCTHATILASFLCNREDIPFSKFVIIILLFKNIHMHKHPTLQTFRGLSNEKIHWRPSPRTWTNQSFLCSLVALNITQLWGGVSGVTQASEDQGLPTLPPGNFTHPKNGLEVWELWGPEFRRVRRNPSDLESSGGE